MANVRDRALQSRIDDVRRPVQDRIDDQLILAPRAKQLSANELSFDGGRVIMVFPWQNTTVAPRTSTGTMRVMGLPDGATTQDIHGCPTEVFGNDWYCFYANSGWGGRRRQWSDPYSNYVFFSNYGFNNQASSWVNGGSFTVRVYDDGVGPGTALWTEGAHSSSSYVGASKNDRADYFTAY